MSLALAANAALFAICDGLLFRLPDLPFASRIVHVEAPVQQISRWSAQQMSSVQERVSDTALFETGTRVRTGRILDEENEPQTAEGIRPVAVSSGFFAFAGVRPALGQAFDAPYVPRTPREVVIGHELWQARFGGDWSIVGRTIFITGTVSSDPWVITGVMPPGFNFPDGANFWAAEILNPSGLEIPTFVRLAPGSSIQAARAAFPELTFTPILEHGRAASAASLPVLLAASSLLLLVGFVQITGFFFWRTSARMSEIGIRAALGATRAQVLGQFIAEAAIVSALSGAAAALIARPLTSLMARWLPYEVLAGHAVTPDFRTFFFGLFLVTFGFSVLALGSTLVIWRRSPSALLRSGDLTGVTQKRSRIPVALFACQLSLSTALVYLAVLACQGVVQMMRVDVGFQPAGLYSVRAPMMSIPRGLPAEQARAAARSYMALVAGTAARIRGLPGVESIAHALWSPIERNGLPLVKVGIAHDETRPQIEAQSNTISLGFIDTIGATVVDGIEPSLRHRDAEVGVALVNETLARHLEESGPVIGQVISTTRVMSFEVTGVVADINSEGPDKPPAPAVYLYFPEGVESGATYVIRLKDPGDRDTPKIIRTIMDSAFGDRAPKTILSVSDVVDAAGAYHRAQAMVLSIIGLLCLAISATGIAGTIAYITRQRSREAAIRRVLGADEGFLVRQLARGPLAVLSASVAMGLFLGVTAAGIATSFFFGVTAFNAVAFTVTGGAVGFVACLSAVLPTRRVLRTNLAVALRHG